MKPDIILIGGGGHCRSCIDVIERQDKYDIVGIVDLPEKKGEIVLGYEYIGVDDDLPHLAKSYDNFIITIGHLGSAQRRLEIFEYLKQLGKILPSIISPLAYVSNHAEINEGSIIMHLAVINAGAKIGSNCIINTKALVEHDVVIEDNCHISTGAIVNGGVRVGKNTFYGSGAISKQNIEIPDNSFIKANSIVK